jgi:hypothetical protein
MYRRPRFLEALIKIREEMAREADYDTDLFAEMVRSGARSGDKTSHSLSDTDAGGSERRRKRTHKV